MGLEEQKWDRRGINLTSDSACAHHPSHEQVDHTELAHAPLIESTGQPQSSLCNPFPASGQASPLSQMIVDSTTFEGPTSSNAAQSQYQMVIFNTMHGPIQVPVDVQTTSEIANEKRKRNATASHRFRQRRKEQEQEASGNIDRLEAQIRERTEERDHYRKERDYFRDVAVRNRVPTEPRPLSPWRRRHVRHGGTSLAWYQGVERCGRIVGDRDEAKVPTYHRKGIRH